MIKLDTLQEICSGLAWANRTNLLKDTFEVDVTLPFPFYEALQKELTEKVNNAPMLVNETDDNVNIKHPMKFTKVAFPNGIRLNIKEGKEGIVIQPVKRPTVNPSQLLFPFNSEGVK